VSYGNIREKPDLSPIFGPLQKDENGRITDLLLQIDERLNSLAQLASQHVGVPYKHTGLGLFAGKAGEEIAGGPYGDAGDIWFEIQRTGETTGAQRGQTWTVESRIIIYCADPQPDCNCTHALVGLAEETNTPMSAVEALAAHVDELTLEVVKRTASEFTGSAHATLVAMGCPSL
jgi:hypothetical protein